MAVVKQGHLSIETVVGDNGVLSVTISCECGSWVHSSKDWVELISDGIGVAVEQMRDHDCPLGGDPDDEKGRQ